MKNLLNIKNTNSYLTKTWSSLMMFGPKHQALDAVYNTQKLLQYISTPMNEKGGLQNNRNSNIEKSKPSCS